MDQISAPAITLQDAIEFVWLEADLLDHRDYDAWLALWEPDGLYVVPIEPGETDFAGTLNYAYDDHDMRSKRVRRLASGLSISASPIPRTVRSQSRFRMLEASMLRCAQVITEFRRGVERSYTADVEYRLVRGADGLKLAQKVVRLINSDAPLHGIGYVL